MNIGVFCASSDKIDPIYFKDALRLGAEIAKRSWGLVYGGTNLGLMREIADATTLNGGETIGIIPECMVNKGIIANRVTTLLIAADMKERKQMLREWSDAFIALPGGWGTLEEITEVITLKQLGIHNKPIVFVNTGNFYQLFFNFIRDIRDRGFITPIYDELYVVVDGVDEAVKYIETYRN